MTSSSTSSRSYFYTKSSRTSLTSSYLIMPSRQEIGGTCDVFLLVSILAILCTHAASAGPGLDGNISTTPTGNSSILALVAGYQGSIGSIATPVNVWDGAAWSITGSLADGRRGFEMAKLPGGRVMAAGGTAFGSANPTTGTQIWSPGSGIWQAHSGMMVESITNFSRQDFRMVALEDGRVLAAGGYYPGGPANPIDASASAELWDLATMRWSETGSMAYKRPGGFEMVLLGDGRVLVVGGSTAADPTGGGAAVSAEIYDPVTGLFTLTGNMTVPRTGQFGLSLLADGRVMVAGGGGLDPDTELWDPETGEWSDGGPLTTLGYKLSMAPIRNGTALFATSLVEPTFTTTEVWEEEGGGGNWTRAGPFTAPALNRQAGLLSDGRVLVLGTPLDPPGANTAIGGDAPLANATLSAETFDPATLACSPAGRLASVKVVSVAQGVTSFSGGFRMVTF